MTAASRDRGSATIWVLAAAALVLAVAVLGALRCGAVLARHRAETAADLAALAAAARIGVDGNECAAAGRLASANGGRLTGCRVVLDPGGRSGWVSVFVVIAVELPIVGSGSALGRASARRDPPVERAGASRPNGALWHAGRGPPGSTGSTAAWAPAARMGRDEDGDDGTRSLTP